ncbi:MAG: pyridoxal-phosphate-dependent aminotransferase family protein [Bryobacteraceae bacterium]
MTERLTAPKRLLYGPGPSVVEDRALEAMKQPALGIRDPYFLQVVDEVRTGLRTLFGTTNPKTFPIPSSGSGAMETAIANFVRPGSKFAIFAAGHFADRAAIMAARQGATVVKLEKPWGEVFTEAEAQAFIAQEHPDTVCFVQAETSSGAYQSGKAIAPFARASGALVIADTVTSLGAMPVELDKIGIDVAYSCSQKGLSCPAGLSPFSVSPRAWEQLSDGREESRSWYFDLKLMAQYYDPPHTYHHTPSPPLFYAMHEALAVIEEEGLSARCARHRAAGEQLMQGLISLGFQPLVKNPEDRVWHVSTVIPPDGVDEAGLRKRLMDRYDIEIAGGLGRLAGKVIRIGVMGPLAEPASVKFLLDSINSCL